MDHISTAAVVVALLFCEQPLSTMQRTYFQWPRQQGRRHRAIDDRGHIEDTLPAIGNSPDAMADGLDVYHLAFWIRRGFHPNNNVVRLVLLLVCLFLVVANVLVDSSGNLRNRIDDSLFVPGPIALHHV